MLKDTIGCFECFVLGLFAKKYANRNWLTKWKRLVKENQHKREEISVSQWVIKPIGHPSNQLPMECKICPKDGRLMKNVCLTWWSPAVDTKINTQTAAAKREMENRNHLNEIQRRKAPARNLWLSQELWSRSWGSGCGRVNGSASGTISLTRTMKASEWKITIVTTANRFFIAPAHRETFHAALKLIWK